MFLFFTLKQLQFSALLLAQHCLLQGKVEQKDLKDELNLAVLYLVLSLLIHHLTSQTACVMGEGQSAGMCRSVPSRAGASGGVV